MNDFDMRRIENAIWVLKQYDYEIREIIKEEHTSWEGEKLFTLLNDIENYIRDKLEIYTLY